jgi:hypothetical protein
LQRIGTGLHSRSSLPYHSPVLETLPAKDGPTLSGLEGDGRLLAALRANRLGFHALRASRAVAVTIPLRTSRLAGLATLRLVFETLVGEKHLFARCEDEFCPTIGTLQDPIMVFHTLLRTRTGRGPAAMSSRQCEISRLRIHR